MPLLERQWILEAGKAKGWHPREVRRKLADETGIDYFRICEYINGRRNPEIPRAKKMAKVLGVAWTRFFEDQAS